MTAAEPAANSQAAQAPQTSQSKLAALVSLAKRRGFIFQASEIYGGMNGVYDYGPLGAQFKKNLKDSWWRDMVESPPLGIDGKPVQIVGLDSAILQLRKVWDVVGHTANFNDQMVDCRESKNRYRADHIQCFFIKNKDGSPAAELIAVMDGDGVLDDAKKRFQKLRNKFPAWGELSLDNSRDLLTARKEGFAETIIGPEASAPGTLTEPRAFNLMFQTYVGAIQSDDSKTFLRPETCQGIFTNFKNVLDTSRVKVPFGIAQIGKAFRNEVTPRNYTFRTREFEQMELEFFCNPEESLKWFDFWVAQRYEWWQGYGLKKSSLFQHVIPAEERAFYSQGTVDLEYQFPFTAPGFGELEGVAHRGDFDLSRHQEGSKTKLNYFDAETSQNFIPHVIEPSAGADRGCLALLCDAYQYDESRPSPEWLKLDPRLAPVKLGVFPLVNKDGVPEVAEKIYNDLRKSYICQYDAKQSIGKRYARMDECGTPLCVTVDHDSLNDQKVTVRDRNTAQQERVAIDQLGTYVAGKLR